AVAIGRRGTRAALPPRRREDREGRLRVREHGVAGRPRSLCRLGAGGRRVRRFLAGALLVVLVGCGAALYVVVGQPQWFERLRYPLHYSEYVRVHAREHSLDPALLAAVIYQESKFDARAESTSGAIGLMQLTPATAEGIAIRTGG